MVGPLADGLQLHTHTAEDDPFIKSQLASTSLTLGLFQMIKWLQLPTEYRGIETRGIAMVWSSKRDSFGISDLGVASR